MNDAPRSSSGSAASSCPSLSSSSSDSSKPKTNSCNSSSKNNSSSNSSTIKVRVGVRVRPRTNQEIADGGKSVLQAQPPQIRLGERCFTYDAVFVDNTSQTQLYESVAEPLLNSFLDGYNATIMAYGQTGSGKTFTMGSEAHEDLELCDKRGLIPRFMTDIFSKLKEKHDGNGNEFTLQASFLEVYGEDVHDLLDPARHSLPLREDANGGVICTGLTHRSISTAAQALVVLHEGTMNRTTAATLMNLTSSRSHAVFTIDLTQSQVIPDGDTTTTTSIASRFTFVDLAGSERMKKTGAQGERAREGIKINEGLLALGNVINALADEDRLAEGKKVHVPYRQSKLTRLLQDALGGNSQTLFLACVSPSDTNASETLSTLHYANRARNIKNAPTKNVDGNLLEIQRLHALTHIMQAELVKIKFPGDESYHESSEVGEIDQFIYKRPEVIEFLEKIHTKAAEKQGSVKPISITLSQPAPQLQMHTHITACALPASSTLSIATAPLPKLAPTPMKKISSFNNLRDSDLNKSILLDTTILEEVNPDEEMEILDKLLELQHREQEFCKEQKTDHAELQVVEGELAEQESLLLQLRESLIVYHDMRQKYETLMSEVQQLEVEKTQLAEQLERANVDPTKGCSKSIKRELERVEKRLARVTVEKRQHREKYLKAAEEAKKCAALERKVHDLKNERVKLLKKQEETLLRHRGYTEAKTREIMAFKRREKRQEQQMSKLKTEIQVQKKNLEKRKDYCNKLASKLKQTEEHFMKFLSMRQREVRGRTSIAVGRRTSFLLPNPNIPDRKDEGFAPPSKALDSLKLFLDKIIKEKVNNAEVELQYQDRVHQYSEAMKGLIDAVKKRDDAKSASDPSDESEEIQEMDQAVDDLELKVELIGQDLDNLRIQVTEVEAKIGSGHDTATEKIVKDKDAPVLRTLLVDCINDVAETKLQYNRLDQAMKLKESAIESLDEEVERLNKRLEAVSSEVRHWRSLEQSGDDVVGKINSLESEKGKLSEQLERLRKHSHELEKQNKSLEIELAEARENVALVQATLKQKEYELLSKDVLEELQSLWRKLGSSPETRKKAHDQIADALKDTCERKLKEVIQLKVETENQIETIREETNQITKRLDITDEMEERSVSTALTLLEELDGLQQKRLRLEPKFTSALERRNKLLKQFKDLATALEIESNEIPSCLLKLSAEMEEHSDLSDTFLSACDAELSRLRSLKSILLIRNAEIQKECFTMVTDMNLFEGQLLSLVVETTKRRLGGLPTWWNHASAEAVARVIAVEAGVVKVGKSFNQHLVAIHDSIRSLAKSRGELSNMLRNIIEHAQKILLSTVDGEIDAITAYSNFHDALFRLPALSRERMNSCITEMEALLSGVEAMTQSEIEALSVVWEALNVSSSDRGTFWDEVEQGMIIARSKPEQAFDCIAKSSMVDCEEWIIDVVANAKRTHQQLEARLFKLEKIHQEVERLRFRQDAKSKIISLDSEIRILGAKLSEFEEEKCNKDRLLSKKTGSSTLLKEERYRKHMQQKYAAKLAELTTILRSWKQDEHNDIDSDILSDEVCALLKNNQDMDTWVEARTEFMHLRTVKSSSKRTSDGIRRTAGSASPPRKRQATVGPGGSERKSVTKKGSTTETSSMAKRKTCASEMIITSRSSPPLEGRAPESATKTTATARERVAETMRRAQKRKESCKSSIPATDSKVPRRLNHMSGSRKALSPQRNKLDTVPENPKSGKKINPFGQVMNSTKKLPPSKRLTLPPFAQLLQESPCSPMKENEPK